MAPAELVWPREYAGLGFRLWVDLPRNWRGWLVFLLLVVILLIAVEWVWR